jgi:hypothetical protein
MVNQFGDSSPPQRTSLGEWLNENHTSPQNAENHHNGDPAAGNDGIPWAGVNNSVFDRYAELATFADSLQPKGWTQVRPPDTATLEAWRRPGGTHPVSAKVLKANPYVLVNWSEDSGLPVGAGQKLTKARLHAHLYHGGDESAVAKDLIAGNAIGVPTVIAAPLAQPRDNVTDVSSFELSGEDAPSSSWRPVDLTPVLDGTWKPATPTIGQRTDGKGLFYPAKTHTVVAETEAGKSWFGLAASVCEMARGCHVFYIDFEDDEGSVAGRLLNLGVKAGAIRDLFHYIRPEHPLQGVHLAALCEELASYGPSLAMLDGITEAMELHGLNPIDNADIARFNRTVSLPLAASGAAQVSFDHVTKDREGRGRYALGGVHELNIVSGAGKKISKYLEGDTADSQNQILKDVPGNRDGKIAALRILKEEGYVTPAKPYESLKRYRASDEK